MGEQAPQGGAAPGSTGVGLLILGSGTELWHPFSSALSPPPPATQALFTPVLDAGAYPPCPGTVLG